MEIPSPDFWCHGAAGKVENYVDNRHNPCAIHSTSSEGLDMAEATERNSARA